MQHFIRVYTVHVCTGMTLKRTWVRNVPEELRKIREFNEHNTEFKKIVKP